MSGDPAVSVIRGHGAATGGYVCVMGSAFTEDHRPFLLASAGFERALRTVEPGQWAWPAPCTEWDVRQLVNHMTRGNLNYVLLAQGGTKAGFLRLRDADALGDDPVAASRQNRLLHRMGRKPPGSP